GGAAAMAEREHEVVTEPLQHAGMLTLDEGFRQTVAPEPHHPEQYGDGEQPTMPKPRPRGKRRRSAPTSRAADLTGEPCADWLNLREARIPTMDDRAEPARSLRMSRRTSETHARTRRYVSRIT